MVVQQQNKRFTVGGRIIAHNNEGAPLSLLRTPQIDVGVLIAKVVALKIGEGRPHQINYVIAIRCAARRQPPWLTCSLGN